MKITKNFSISMVLKPILNISKIFLPNASTHQIMVKNISQIYLIFTQNAGHINTQFLKSSLNAFILLFQNKSMKFDNILREIHVSSNSLFFQKDSQEIKTKNKMKCFCFFKVMILMDLFHFFQTIQQLISQKNKNLKNITLFSLVILLFHSLISVVYLVH